MTLKLYTADFGSEKCRFKDKSYALLYELSYSLSIKFLKLSLKKRFGITKPLSYLTLYLVAGTGLEPVSASGGYELDIFRINRGLETFPL